MRFTQLKNTNAMTTSYLQSARQQFEYYKTLGEKTFAQLPDEALFVQPGPESNSIATIVKHLWGNMLSRWTDFLNSDGDKEWRQRDAEFENDVSTRAEMMRLWHEGWNCLFAALDELTDADLHRVVYIRNEAHSVVEAINRQLAHYPFHVGQIVYIAKVALDTGWVSLSIPRGQSEAYRAQRFTRPQQ